MVGFEAPTLGVPGIGRPRASRVEEAQSDAGSVTGRSVIFGVKSGGFDIVVLKREKMGGLDI